MDGILMDCGDCLAEMKKDILWYPTNLLWQSCNRKIMIALQ